MAILRASDLGRADAQSPAPAPGTALERQLARETAEISTWRRDISPTLQLHKLAGCWFEVTLAPLAPGNVLPRGERDAVTADGLPARVPEALYGRAGVYARGKRQLSKRELNERQRRND